MNKLTTAIVATATLAAAAPVMLGAPAGATTVVRHYANCTAMHRVFPHGVGLLNAHDHVTSGTPVTNFARRPRVYDLNKGSDRDHDHVACEKH